VIKACSCKTLGPTTMVNDIKDIFLNNKINDIFSGNALDAFKDFNPIKSLLFWILTIKTTVWFFSVIWGYFEDKRFIKLNPHMIAFNLDDLLNEDQKTP
jgi:hypothetical protein